MIKIKYDQKGWRTPVPASATHTTIVSEGWKQEGLEFISQNETLPAKQVSSHHVKARIIVFSEKMIFLSLNHRQLALSLWFSLTASRPSQNQLKTGSRYVSRSANFTHSQRQSIHSPPTAAGNMLCISLGERNPHRRCRAPAGGLTGCPRHAALRSQRRARRGRGRVSRGQGQAPADGHNQERTHSASPRCRLPLEDGLSL